MLAGAGSGKTRVITRRIAWLTGECGALPEEILAVTFTNKAAREMRGRVEALAAGAPWVSTFHAFGLALLRRFGADLGLAPGFPVFGADESRTILRRVASELGIEDDRLSGGKLAGAVSRLRNAEAAGAAYRGPADPRLRETIREAAAAYREALAGLGGADFDDLLIRSLDLLDASEAARDFAARRVRHLLVDEYQDTSPVQHRLLLRLAPHREVFAVGDDDQSIYSFRGADFRNILRFHQDFPGARVFRLEENYRSTAAILDAANALIRRNRRRHEKTLRPVGEGGRRVSFRAYADEASESRRVAQDIVSLGEDGGSVAVLLRTRAQTRPFEEAFAAHRIPHAVVGGLRFYERREVLDALAWIRLARRDADDSAFFRALASVPRGVGDKSRARIEARAAGEGVPAVEATRSLVEEASEAPRLLRGLSGFLDALARVRRAAETGPQAAVEAAIQDTGLGGFHEEDRDRSENLLALRSAAREFERMSPGEGTSVFLDQVSLLSAEDQIPEEGAGAAPVLVMTVHAAKGLEFDTVFLAGLWEGVFPHGLSLDSDAGLEEERRLFYVGMTRARRRLVLSAAPAGPAFRRTRGGVSRFVGEIPRELLDAETPHPVVRPLPAEPPAPPGAFRKGQAVRHPKFGIGRVEAVDPDGKRLSVLFRYYGRRRLVVEFARLERI